MSRAVVGDLVTQVKRRRRRRGPRRSPRCRAHPPTSRRRSRSRCRRRRRSIRQTAEVLGVFAAQAGQPIEARIASWERYLSTRSGSPFAAAIRRDLDQLHTLRDELRPRDSRRPERHDRRRRSQRAEDARSPATQIPVVFVLEQPRTGRERVSPLPRAREPHVPQHAARARARHLPARHAARRGGEDAGRRLLRRGLDARWPLRARARPRRASRSRSTSATPTLARPVRLERPVARR